MTKNGGPEKFRATVLLDGYCLRDHCDALIGSVPKNSLTKYGRDIRSKRSAQLVVPGGILDKGNLTRYVADVASSIEMQSPNLFHDT